MALLEPALPLGIFNARERTDWRWGSTARYCRVN